MKSDSLKFSVLASGSGGNSIAIWTDRTAILVDIGLSLKLITERLHIIGLDPSRIDGICISHDHSDHIKGVFPFIQKFGCSIFCNSDTARILVEQNSEVAGKLKVFITGSGFKIGDLEIYPFSVPHDSIDPVAFIIRYNNASIGIATDMGMVTKLTVEKLKQLPAVVVEANHDEFMLKESKRPWILKQRIHSNVGHLSNSQTAELINLIWSNNLKVIVLAHLSQECNTPERAIMAIRRKVGEERLRHIKVICASMDKPTEIIEV